VSFLLDTDTCSAHIKQRGGLSHRFVQHGGRLHVSVISAGELFTWTFRANAPRRRLQAVSSLIRDVQVLDVTLDVTRKFGEIRANLLDRGQATPDLDLLIAATALVHDLTLVTHNVQDFVAIPKLRIVDWISS